MDVPPQRGPTANKDPTAPIQPRGTNPYGADGSIPDEFGVCQYILKPFTAEAQRTQRTAGMGERRNDTAFTAEAQRTQRTAGMGERRNNAELGTRNEEGNGFTARPVRLSRRAGIAQGALLRPFDRLRAKEGKLSLAKPLKGAYSMGAIRHRVGEIRGLI